MAVEESASGNASPKTSQATNKMKFFCSNGGMILPRPSDGRLKYVGGETRVISAPRNGSFSDLMRKINHMFEGEFILKYQIGPEELDALVSVKSDEDLRYMFDEYDRLERGGTSKLRTFLFTSKPTMIESHSPTTTSTPLKSLEQRYVDALNGIVHPTNYHNHFASVRPPISCSRLKSMCSSPSECPSPSSLSPRSVVHNSSINAVDAANFINSLNGKLNGMTRVHSSPSLNSLANQNVQPSSSHNQESHHIAYPGYQSSSHHHQQQQQQLSSYNNHMGRVHEHHDVQPWMSPMREDYGRVQSMSNHPPPTGVPSPGHCRPFHKGGSGGHNRWAHLGQYAGAYSTSSHRSAGIHNEPRGIIWE